MMASSVFFSHSKENPQQATRVRSSKYQIRPDTRPDSIRPATVLFDAEVADRQP